MDIYYTRVELSNDLSLFLAAILLHFPFYSLFQIFTLKWNSAIYSVNPLTYVWTV